MNKVFVYGTLKRGGRNHHFMEDQRFLTEAHTPPGFTLYSLGYYPGMVRAPHDTQGVAGELWVVDNDCLALLDDLEGVAEKLYERANITLAVPLLDEPVHTYFYLHDIAGRPHLGSKFAV